MERPTLNEAIKEAWAQRGDPAESNLASDDRFIESLTPEAKEQATRIGVACVSELASLERTPA